MSTVTPHPTLHRSPLGRTFVVAISLLGVFAAIQILAVIGHFIPAMRQQLAAASLEKQQAAPVVTDTRTAPATAPVLQPVPSVANDLKIKQLITEADRNFSLGDYETALRLLDQAEVQVPGDPQILRRKAFVFEKLDQPADAVAALESALRYPGLPAGDRAMLDRKLEQLSNLLDASPGAAPRTLPSLDGGAAMEEGGVPIGATLGISDIRLTDSKVGTKTLQIAVKAREGSTINSKNLVVTVYFYEENPPDGEIRLAEKDNPSQWLSPPIDWADNLPELLRVQYAIPSADTGKTFSGYVVAIYYNDELQDFRSEPSKLAKMFPPALFLPKALKQGSE